MEDLTGKITYDFIEDLYENEMKRGQTFSYDFGEILQAEIDKMNRQKEEWLKKQKEERSNS